jgi:hypothetical protein
VTSGCEQGMILLAISAQVSRHRGLACLGHSCAVHVNNNENANPCMVLDLGSVCSGDHLHTGLKILTLAVQARYDDWCRTSVLGPVGAWIYEGSRARSKWWVMNGSLKVAGCGSTAICCSCLGGIYICRNLSKRVSFIFQPPAC